MIDKIVTTRKEHVCAYCETIIGKGERAKFYITRIPAYDLDDNQTSILYIAHHSHIDENYCNSVLKEKNEI